MAKRKQLKSNLVPYKILVGLLYREYDWANWESPFVAYLQLGKMAKDYKLPSTRLRQYLVWLNEMGYFKNLTLAARGWCRVSLYPPIGHSPTHGKDKAGPPALLPLDLEHKTQAADLAHLGSKLPGEE